MIRKLIVQSKMYLIRIMAVAVVLATATSFTWAQPVAEAESYTDPDKGGDVVYGSRDGSADTDEGGGENITRTYERLIAHGGGSIEGFETSSSKDAVLLAIENGFKMIELDMEFSLDDKIVMLHDWDRTIVTYLGRKFDKKLTLAQFNQQLICGKFEPLTFDKLTGILDSHPDVRIVTDTKGDNLKLLSTIKEKYPDYVDRIVPQIYDYSEYEPVAEMGYKDIIFTLYTQSTIDCKRLAGFVKENNIYAVTVAYNYWVKGVPETLSKEGIIVYTHPISTLEEAEKELSRGVYGVYSSSLIPLELEGFGKEYYLMQEENGKQVKLTDATVKEEAVRKLSVHGNLAGKSFKYKLGEEVLEDGLEAVSDSPSQAHELNIEIWDNAEAAEEPLYTLEYVLTKNEGDIRILDKKYEYRLNSLRDIENLEATLAKANIPKSNAIQGDVMDLLNSSFIAKAGQYYFFNMGESGSYTVGDELMSPQKSLNGHVMVPLSDTLNSMGAERVFMDSSRYVYMAVGEIDTVSQVYSNFVKKGMSNTKVSVPISLYRGKAMAGGEVISLASGRNYIEENDILIILPEDCTISEAMSEKLIETAQFLYAH